MALAPIRNVQKFVATLEELDPTADQMVLVYGPPGAGKTKAAAYTFVRHNGILLRVLSGLSQRALLMMLANELSITLKYSTNGEILMQLLEAISQNPRPIFIDEADRLFENKRLFETVRDIHDVARIPVIMLGASSSAGFVGVDQHLRRYPQMADRVSHWVPFEPANLQDLALLQHFYIPELSLSKDLQKRLLRESKGNVRRICAGFTTCRKLAHRKNKDSLQESDLGTAEIISIAALREVDQADGNQA
jgi:DNA transposition AAA+ family ATPase